MQGLDVFNKQIALGHENTKAYSEEDIVGLVRSLQEKRAAAAAAAAEAAAAAVVASPSPDAVW